MPELLQYLRGPRMLLNTVYDVVIHYFELRFSFLKLIFRFFNRFGLQLNLFIQNLDMFLTPFIMWSKWYYTTHVHILSWIVLFCYYIMLIRHIFQVCLDIKAWNIDILYSLFYIILKTFILNQNFNERFINFFPFIFHFYNFRI